MIKKILKRIIRQPLPCIAVCIFAAVLSFSLCYLQRSLEEERSSFEQTCNSIPISFKLTELDGSKFEGQTGIEPWAMNEFVREYGDFYQLAKEVLAAYPEYKNAIDLIFPGLKTEQSADEE